MATSAAGVQERQKSAPDLAKLMGMTNRVVQVVRHLSRTGAGSLVVPAWKSVTVEQITALQTELPAKFGPGTYSFEVYDEGGPDKDAWVVKLGPDISEMPQQSMPWGANNGGAPFSPVGGLDGGPNGSSGGQGTVDLGNGYRYNEALGLLVTPQKQIINWRPGEDLPGSLPVRPAAPAPGTPPWAQWSQPAGPTPPWAGLGWGANPVDQPAHESPAVKALEERLRESERRREEEERRREADAMRASFEKVIETNNKRFEDLVASLTAKLSDSSKPAVDPQVETLKAQLEQMRQQQEQTRRDEAIRAEVRAAQERTDAALRALADASSNKADPMLNMLTQLMISGQNSQAEVVKAMRDTAQSQAQAAERNSNAVAERLSPSIITPLQMMEIMKLAKDNTAGSEINSNMLGMFKEMFGMAQGLWRERAEMEQGGGGPAWLPLAQEGVQTLGRVAAMYAQTKAREEAASQRRLQPQPVQQPQRVAPRPVPQPQPQPQQRVTAPPPAPRAVAPVASAPATVATTVATARTASDLARDAAAVQVFGQPSALDASRAALADAVFNRKPEPAPVETAAPDAVAPPAPTPTVEPRRRRRKVVEVAPVVAAPVVAAPPPPPPPVEEPEEPEEDEDESGDEGEETSAEDTSALEDHAAAIADANAAVANASSADMRALIADMGDEEFFGPALSEVIKLRETLVAAPETVTPSDLAKFILTARQQLLNFGIFPPAIELLEAGHVDLLVERLLPGFPPAAHAAITQTTRALMQQSGIGPQVQP